jgi:hypothetical protein
MLSKAVKLRRGEVGGVASELRLLGGVEMRGDLVDGGHSCELRLDLFVVGSATRLLLHARCQLQAQPPRILRRRIRLRLILQHRTRMAARLDLDERKTKRSDRLNSERGESGQRSRI